MLVTLPEFVRDAICGGTGAVCCTYSGMPFDTVKVRLQTSSASTFRGPLDCALRSAREEGVASLWKGSLPALASALTENLVVFAANGVIRRTLRAVRSTNDNGNNDDEEYLGFWQEAAVGGASGFCSATAICPAEVIKVRMQSDRTVGARRASFVSSTTRLLREEGARGLFRGLPAIWVRDVPFYVVFFTAYTSYIDAACRFHGCVDPVTGAGVKRDLPTWQYVMGGGLAGMFGWGAVFPVDVIKSRVQLGTMGTDVSLVHAAATLLRKEGARHLMRGYLPAVLRGFPANGALLLGVETMQGLLRAA